MSNKNNRRLARAMGHTHKCACELCKTPARRWSIRGRDDELERLTAENEKLRGLLRAAKCPDPNCDGKGTVCAGAHQTVDGEIIYDLHQCEWCDKSQHALTDTAQGRKHQQEMTDSERESLHSALRESVDMVSAQDSDDD